MIAEFDIDKLPLQDVEQARLWLMESERIPAENLALGMANVEVLQLLGLDEHSCLAGLLHGVRIETDALLEQFAKLFEPEVITLYQGVGRLSQLSCLSRQGEDYQGGKQKGKQGGAETNEDNLRKMLITMVDDVRVVLIKLADQLRLLREARDLSREEQQQLSQLTLDVFAPLANRLGIWQIKWEMEDFALRYRDPGVYKQLAVQLSEKREAREQYITSLLNQLSLAMEEVQLKAEVFGRPKHIYSIWKKMQQKGLSFENLWDIRAVRIVVDSVADCYAALGVVHTLWRHLPGEFDDYIATPKANGYRSIHTVVIGPQDKSVEVQIRTQEMHQDNELGIAAHWRYKEGQKKGKGQDEGIDNKILWLRQLLEWQEELVDSESIEDALKEGAGSERIYVFTPKGRVIDLPEGASPLDFAYSIHSEVGHRTHGARVNGKMVPLTTVLKTADQVQILTLKKGSPSRDWLRPELGYVKTQRARSRIMQWFKHEDYDQNIAEGRHILEKELDRLGLEDLSYERIAKHTPYMKPDDLLAAIGAHDYKLSKALLPFRRELASRIETKAETDDGLSAHFVGKASSALSRKKSDAFRVDGVGNLMTTMAKCCQPVPGDQIVGYITTGRGVTIHNQSCHNITGLSVDLLNRLIEVEWGDRMSGSYPVTVMLSAYHRSGILRDVTQVLQDAKINVLNMGMETDKENIAQVRMQLEVEGLKTLSKTLGQLAKIQNVLDVRRVGN